jgi:hypothetical protein
MGSTRLGEAHDVLFKYMLADQSINSVNLADATDLFFELGQGETWIFDGNLYVSGTANSDFKLTMDAPTGVLGRWGASQLIATTAAASADAAMNSTTNFASGITMSFAALGTGTGVLPVTIHGIIINGVNPGFLKVRWACVAALGAVVLSQYSWLRAFKIRDN